MKARSLRMYLGTLFACLLPVTVPALATAQAAPMKVAVVGLTHGHIGGFFHASALTPAGGILNRPDVQLVAVIEPDDALWDKYAKQFQLAPGLHFHSIAEMAAAHIKPAATLVFTAPDQHRRIVEESAALGINVLMEKPLAFTYADALAMQHAAEAHHIHVFVDFETAWYNSNTEAVHLLQHDQLGPITKAVFRDGHEGPEKIHVQPEFGAWLKDPKQDGDGALTDFGCYGPNLMTWMMNGEAPTSVTAVTKHLQPKLYPGVADEVDMILNYPHATAIVEGSWDWPFAVKQMDLYGETGYAKTHDGVEMEVRLKGDKQSEVRSAPALPAPYDDPLHYMEAVLNGQITEKADLSSLRNNVIVAEILDAARRSAQTGKTVTLPLER